MNRLIKGLALWSFLLLAACNSDKQGSPLPTVELTPSTSGSSSSMATNDEPPQNTVLIYNYGGDDDQYGELRLPAGVEEGEPVPIVVIVHGGCWLEQFKLTFTQDLAEELRQSGYATWNIEYQRLGSGGEWPTIFLDTAKAIDYVATLAEIHNIDQTQVVAIGHSAGGHLALWAAGRHKAPDDSELYDASFQALNGVLAIAPVSDLRSPICSNSLTTLIDGESLSEAEISLRLLYTSPIDMLPIGIKTILLSGDEDNIAPPGFSENYVLAAQSAGDNSEHVVLEGLDHFELILPTSLDWVYFESLLSQLFMQ